MQPHERTLIDRDRLIMFSDGVFAIVITLLVLEISSGEGDAWIDLDHTLPQLRLFAWSFFLIARFWQLHVQLFGSLDKKVPSQIASINTVLLFFIALLPFTTKFFNNHLHQPLAVALYASVICAIGLIQVLLHRMTLRLQKSKLSISANQSLPFLTIPIFMAISIPAAFLMPAIAYSLWGVVVVLNLARIRFVHNTAKR